MVLGANDQYIGLCRKHWMAGDLGPDFRPEDPAVICRLCPRNCGEERTETRRGGVCGMPSVPVAARAMLHLWEEPCLVGERGAGCVFFSGCNLRCCFCQNKPISQGRWERS